MSGKVYNRSWLVFIFALFSLSSDSPITTNPKSLPQPYTRSTISLSTISGPPRLEKDKRSRLSLLSHDSLICAAIIRLSVALSSRILQDCSCHTLYTMSGSRSRSRSATRRRNEDARDEGPTSHPREPHPRPVTQAETEDTEPEDPMSFLYLRNSTLRTMYTNHYNHHIRLGQTETAASSAASSAVASSAAASSAAASSATASSGAPPSGTVPRPERPPKPTDFCFLYCRQDEYRELQVVIKYKDQEPYYAVECEEPDCHENPLKCSTGLCMLWPDAITLRDHANQLINQANFPLPRSGDSLPLPVSSTTTQRRNLPPVPLISDVQDSLRRQTTYPQPSSRDPALPATGRQQTTGLEPQYEVATPRQAIAPPQRTDY